MTQGSPRLDVVEACAANRTMSTIRNVCVYCGSSDGADARFADAAEELGRTLGAGGLGLVYGGGGEGLMGRLARSTLAAGGYVTGIIPSFLIRKEHPLTAVQEILVVENMHERKQAMFDRADAFIALPGGVGTVEELVEQLTWAQLNRHTKPILIVDIGGFWRPLLALFAHMRLQGTHSRGLRRSLHGCRANRKTCCQCCMPPPSGAQSSLSLRTRSPLATCNVRARGFTFAIVAPSSRAQAHAAQALGGRKLMTCSS